MLGPYEGEGHPWASYYCNKKVPPDAFEHWRLGRAAWNHIRDSYTDGGKLSVSFVEGVEAYKGEVLFLTSSCDTILGVELQQKQMQYFTNARMVVVEGVGHSLFGEKLIESLAPVREKMRILVEITNRG